MSTAVEAPKLVIVPRGKNVVLTRTPERNQSAGGITLTGKSVERDSTATVLAIGERVNHTKDGVPRATSLMAGDLVLLSEFEGNDYELSGEKFVVVDYRLIKGVIGRDDGSLVGVPDDADDVVRVGIGEGPGIELDLS